MYVCMYVYVHICKYMHVCLYMHRRLRLLLLYDDMNSVVVYIWQNYFVKLNNNVL